MHENFMGAVNINEKLKMNNGQLLNELFLSEVNV
jgi:hypothetical protein